MLSGQRVDSSQRPNFRPVPTMATGNSPVNMKYLSLVILVAQNTGLVLIMRYSRTVEGPRYLSSTAVVMSEISKVVTCLLIVLYQKSWSLSETAGVLRTEIAMKKMEDCKDIGSSDLVHNSE